MVVSEFLLDSVLHEKFGLTEFRPKQREVIDHVLQGKNVLALLPTGYGKSLCYQVPSQVLTGTTIVVSPLIALMQDQVSGMQRRGIFNSTYLNSSVSPDEQDIRFGGIKAGAFKLVYVAPERFESPRFRNLLATIPISLLVIDEAHCISQWGHDFRPQYRNLRNHLALMQGTPVLAMTATATPGAQRDILQQLDLPGMKIVTASFDRPNIHFAVETASAFKEKDAHVLRLLRNATGSSIVYTSSRKDAEAVADRLRRSGLSAGCYHAGMSGEQRHRTQRNFENDNISIIVSTVAFGMGVDKANIRQVIHYSMPGSIENYYQEAGRAGRDGNPATCTMLHMNRDIVTQRWLMNRNFPEESQIYATYNLIRGVGLKPVKATDLLDQMKISDSALNAALDLLKGLKLIDTAPDGSFFILNDVKQIDVSSLNQRKLRDSARLDRMNSYAQSRVCRRRQILEYFGQQLETSCTGCDVCKPNHFVVKRSSHSPAQPATTGNSSYKTQYKAPSKAAHFDDSGETLSSEKLTESILVLANELSGKAGRTTLAQVLVGSQSKKLKERQLDQSALYGKYSWMKQDEVVEVVDSLINLGQLRQIPGMYPKVVITDTGKEFLATL